MLNKPRGVLCTREEGRGTTVYDLLRGVRERVVTAGRLDRDSEGLIILSNDGALVNRLTHPRFGHTKVYRVQAAGVFDQATLDALASRATAAITSDVSRRRLALEALASRRCLTNPYAMVEDRATTLELTAERLHASLPRLVARRGEQVGMLGMRLDAAGGRIAVGERALVDPLDARLRRAGKRLFEPYEALLARHAASLDALSPLKVIGRGYAIAKDADGHVVTTVAALAPQDAVTVLVGDGEFDATVTQVRCAQKED